VSGPRLALRDVRHGRRVVDLLFYDDVLAVLPVRSGDGEGDPRGWVLAAALALAFGPRLQRRKQRREESPATLPRRVRLVRLADVVSVEVTARPYGGAVLRIDGRTYDVPDAVHYRPPWREVLGPSFGDRLTVVEVADQL